jgi:phosphatidylethanolamine/phosphatidyl-N-methylethanolamine N-methyltransferase
MKTKVSNTETFWNSFAIRYDRFVQNFVGKIYGKLMELIPQDLQAGARVFELGTGTGIISFGIANKVKGILAIDYSQKMIELAQEKQKACGNTNIVFKTGNAYQLEMEDKSADVVIASNILHLLEYPNRALGEVSRILKDNGKVILPTFCSGQNLKCRIYVFFMELSGFRVCNKWTANTYREFIENEGFTVSSETILKGKVPLSYIVATKKINDEQK